MNVLVYISLLLMSIAVFAFFKTHLTIAEIHASNAIEVLNYIESCCGDS